MEKSFARRITWKPLINSLIFGAAVGTFLFIILNQNWGIGVSVAIIVAFIQSSMVYPRYLPKLYGYWRIDNGNVYYNDYSTWTKRIKAIFLPWSQKLIRVPFEDITSYSLVVSKKKKTDKWTPHYIVLRLDNGEDIALDLSWNLKKSGDPEKDVEWVVDFITSKLNQKTVQVLQV